MNSQNLFKLIIITLDIQAVSHSGGKQIWLPRYSTVFLYLATYIQPDEVAGLGIKVSHILPLLLHSDRFERSGDQINEQRRTKRYEGNTFDSEV